MDVLRAERRGTFTRGERFVELAQREVHLSLGQPCLEAGRVDHDRFAELGQGRGFVADREVERGRLGQGLGAGDGLDGFHADTLGRGGRGASAPFTLGKRGGLRTLG